VDRLSKSQPAGGFAQNSSLINDLKIRRYALGLSLSELAECSGVDEHSLSEAEHGNCSLRLDALHHWATALGLALTLTPAESECRHGLAVDWERRRITVDGAPVRLTPMEWKALERLARSPGELVTHQALFRHLYGDDRQDRAQSTAVRVLITKLRRLLPVRIEAQWGQGYVLTGLNPSGPANATPDHGEARVEPALRSVAADKGCERVVTKAAPRNPPPLRREIVMGNTAIRQEFALAEPAMRRAAVAPAPRPVLRRADELGVIERFLAERGVTRCPDVATIQQQPLPTLVWDKMKRKWVRPQMDAREAR
jgi:transcriptional regulator with XRE-family HTH domain